MMKREWKILIPSLLIATLGIISIYSSVYQKATLLWQQQMVWVGLGVLIFLILSHFNYRRLWDATYFLYGLIVFLLVLVDILGSTRLGAQRWLKIAWFNLQPAELAKLALVIFLARYYSKKSADDVSLTARKFGTLRGVVLPFIILLLPMFLILEQPDLGSAALVFFLFLGLLYLSNIRAKYIFLFLIIILLSLPLLWGILRGYQKERLLVFLNPNLDPLGAGYTIIQSKIAIGSGALFGKGWLAGTQGQLYFLPEAHTDFIFATFAEEWGFLGANLLLGLYYFLIRQGFEIAKATSDHFGKLLAFGISLMLLLEVFINLAMTMGLAPVVGIPLPLMSYGGSSVVVTFMALGILVNINRERAIF